MIIYSGTITIHREMGCGTWPQFHDDRGLYGDKNQYWDWDWTINFNDDLEKIDFIKIYDLKSEEVIYCGTLTLDPIHTLFAGIWCPDEISKNRWMDILNNNHKVEIHSNIEIKGYKKWLNKQIEDVLLGE